MNPLTKLLTTRCSPRPMPTPSAPPKTAKAVMSKPAVTMAASTASVSSTNRMSFDSAIFMPSSSARLRSTRLRITLASHSATSSRNAMDRAKLRTLSRETRTLPKLSAYSSSSCSAQGNQPRMCSATSVQMVTVSTPSQALSGPPGLKLWRSTNTPMRISASAPARIHGRPQQAGVPAVPAQDGASPPAATTTAAAAPGPAPPSARRCGACPR